MSDDHDDNCPPYPHVHVQDMGEVFERAKMQGQQNAHTTLEALESMTEEQLRALRSILITVHADSEGHANGYFMGICSMILKFKHNVCPGCGQDHDKQLQEMGEGDTGEAAGKAMEASDKDALMEEYGMEPNPVEGSPGEIRCKGCGSVSVSIEDRMLRPPGVKGCEGCQHKAKWG